MERGRWTRDIPGAPSAGCRGVHIRRWYLANPSRRLGQCIYRGSLALEGEEGKLETGKEIVQYDSKRGCAPINPWAAFSDDLGLNTV
jgi:hypothetical protein